MKKSYLLTPGPTPIPEPVLAVLGQPIIHHRMPTFQAILDDVKVGLKYLYQTKQDVIILTATGTGAMEAAVSNLFKRGDKTIVINGGKFGERWTKISKVFGLQPIEIVAKPGEAIDPKHLGEFIKNHPDARGILFQATETSTGVRMPTQEICQLAKKAGMISICDAITACGVFDLPMDAWDIDVMITGSQKALMIPPGLSMIALSEQAWEMNKTADLPRFYFDLAKERKVLAKNQTSWTPGISLIQALQVSLHLIKEEGLHNVFKRHDLLASATRNAVEALGLKLFAKQSPSNAVTAVRVPSQIKDGKLIPKTMRDKYGVSIAGGQDELEGQIFRLSHFGYCDRFDITTGIAALELTLHDLGYKVQFGKGVGAVLSTFSEV